MLKSINPYTNKVIKTYNLNDKQTIEEKLNQADKAYEKWRDIPFEGRAEFLKRVAENLRNNQEEYASLITSEMGMPISLATWEVGFCADICDHFAKNGADYLKDEIVETDDQLSYIKYQPIGPLLAVMPWNFPFAQVFRFAVPTIMAGNVVLLKHSSNVPGSALAIEKVFTDAGSGSSMNVFQTLLVKSNTVSSIIEDSRIKGITVTGSESAGSNVASQAGLNLKRTVLELGGSDPFIVCNDVNIDEIAEQAAIGRTRNSGQSCTAAKRFLVHADVYDEFLTKFKSHMKKIKVGNPMDKETEIGPMASPKLRDELHLQVTKSIKNGAECILGGEIDNQLEGAYYPATILTNVKSGMPAYEDELFGPVAIVMKFNDYDEAIKLANDTRFGLGASIWTNDIKHAQSIAAKIDSGIVGINQRPSADLRLPSGGIKSSGYGREGAAMGMKEFVNIKTVRIT